MGCFRKRAAPSDGCINHYHQDGVYMP
jgi:hypothetical protein